MTFHQAAAFAIVAGMMAMFYWGRLRYDLVAVLTLLVAVAAGIVPHDKAFTGFSNDIVIIVASALVVSAAVARSGVIEDDLFHRNIESCAGSGDSLGCYLVGSAAVRRLYTDIDHSVTQFVTTGRVGRIEHDEML